MIDRMFIQEEKTTLALDKQLAKEKPGNESAGSRVPAASSGCGAFPHSATGRRPSPAFLPSPKALRADLRFLLRVSISPPQSWPCREGTSCHPPGHRKAGKQSQDRGEAGRSWWVAEVKVVSSVWCQGLLAH